MKIAFINYYPKSNSRAKAGSEHSIESILKPLEKHLLNQNVEIEEINLDSLSIHPCEGCTEKINFVSSECCNHKTDDMNSLYPILRSSDVWLFAVSLNNKLVPKKLINFIDRLEPLFKTSDSFFEDSLSQISIKNKNGKVFLLSTSELWGKDIFRDLSEQIQSVALLFSKDYFGEILRPHFGVFSTMLKQQPDFANNVDENLSLLAKDLAKSSKISDTYLEEISSELISKRDFDLQLEKVLYSII